MEAYEERRSLGIGARPNGAAIALACLVSLLIALSPLHPAAFAVDAEKQKTALELAQQVEDTQAAYAEARAAVDQANEAIEENEQRIAEIEEALPEQQRQSSLAMRELYKYQQQSAGIVELLLSADSFHGFLAQLQYVTYIADANMNEIRKLDQMKAELESIEDELGKARSEADSRADAAREAMDAAAAAQAEVQQRIEEEARMEAEIAAAAAALAEQPRDNDQGSIAEPTPAPAPEQEAPAESGGSGDAGGATSDATSTSGTPTPVETSSDEATFISQWAPRIDAYLAGSPLAGQGTTFARAAYTYNVDPRWSPAISCTESSKGRYCFAPHNAWGWGSSSWGSWEEAIDAHVRGLSRGYGYTISEAAAKKYCPPNWQHWYNTTLAQMNLI